jgi:hypothetical protein
MAVPKTHIKAKKNARKANGKEKDTKQHRSLYL